MKVLIKVQNSQPWHTNIRGTKGLAKLLLNPNLTKHLFLSQKKKNKNIYYYLG